MRNRITQLSRFLLLCAVMFLVTMIPQSVKAITVEEAGEAYMTDSQAGAGQPLYGRLNINYTGNTNYDTWSNDVSFADGKVLVNGEALDESTYLDDTIITECEYTYDVPNGCVFVLGDNRQDSNDSRYWSNPYVSISSIKAKLMFVIPIHELL